MKRAGGKRLTAGAAVAALLLLALSGGAAASSPAPAHGAGKPLAHGHKLPLPPNVLKRLAAHARRGTKTSSKHAPKVARTPQVRARNARGVGHMAADLPGDLTTAIEATGQTFAGAASFVTAPLTGTPDALASSLDPTLTAPGFPSDGSDYAVLSSGDANLAGTPNSAPDTGADDSCAPGDTGCGADGDPTSKGANRGNAHDVSILKIPLTVPKGQNCLSFDYRFVSDEYPEWVGTPYNDSFIAELDKNSWTATGTNPQNPISAPNNFAFDPGGRPISINAIGTTSMSPGGSFNTTYDGGTPLLKAQTPITAGAHTLYLSIFDQGDWVYDSAVFLDNLALSAAKCSSGSVVNEQPADLQLTKSGETTETGINYTLTVHNAGPATADNVTVTDPLPEGLSYVGSENPDGSCGFASGTVSCAIDSLAPGESAAISIGVTGDPATYFNTATAASSTFDPLHGNNTASSTDMIGNGGIQNVDLSLVKAGPDSMNQGQIVDYQFTVTNNGPDTLTNGIEVTDALPAGLYPLGCLWNDGVGDVPPQFDGCSLSNDGKTLYADVEPGFSLASESSIEISLLAYVTATGTVQNSAGVDSWFGTNDSNTDNNTSSTTMTVAPTALTTGDVVVTKTVDKLLAPIGDTLTYTITVTNKGSKELKQVGVFDTPDTGESDTSVNDSLGQCTELSPDGGFDCTLDLGAGKSDKITYVTSINDGAGDWVANYAESFPDGYFDPNFANNFATAYTKVGEGTPQVADLAATVTSPASAGITSVVNSTVKVTNNGPNAVNDVVVDLFSFAWETGGTLVSLPDGCDMDFWECDVGTLAKGASKTIPVTWITPPYPAPQFVAAGAFSTDDTWVDTNDANSSGYATTDVTQATSDLGVSISDVDPILNGGNETWTIKVTNAGPDPAANVQVVDGLPGDALFQSASGGGFGCAGLLTVTCTLKSPLAKGASATVTLVAKVNTENDLPSSITNVVTATTESYDPDLSNNTDVEETAINAPNADLAITNTDSPDPVVVGSKVTYTLQVTNLGPLTAPTPTVTDNLPEDETFVSATGAKCTGTTTITCPLADLKAKGTVKIVITVTVNPASPPVDLVNAATVGSSLLDANTANNEDDETTTVNPPYADLAVTGSATPNPVAKSGSLTFKYTVKNIGPQSATGTTLAIDLPDGVTLPAKPPAGCTFSAGDANCALGTLTKGASKTVSVVVKAPNTGNTPLGSTGTAASALADPNSGNNQAVANSATKCLKGATC